MGWARTEDPTTLTAGMLVRSFFRLWDPKHYVLNDYVQPTPGSLMFIF